MSSSTNSPVPLFKIKVAQKGIIKDVKEVVCRVVGLPSCLNGQIVDLGRGVRGIIMGYDQNEVLVLVLGDPGKLRMGGDVFGVDEPFVIPVGMGFIGRMVSALGDPCDQQGDVKADAYYPVMCDSPSIVKRDPPSEFLATGTKVVDAIIPLAKGQRMLIVGDRVTGKTTIAVDAILNQKDRNMVCIYCCIGKSVSALEKVLTTLREKDALSYTAIVAASDSSPVGEQYLVPYSAVSLAEYFASKGKNVLVVFDDLTKHAWAYRQLSLLLERPPGREAYPGDIFYVQTQLMERAGCFNAQHGGGSISFIGIAETLQGDLTGYIPSNLASICDGQICMSSTLFAEGMRPAIDFSISLTIIGARVQPRIVKKLAGQIRVDFARFTELAQLSKLQTGLSHEAEQIVTRGQTIQMALRQGSGQPIPIAHLVLCLYALKINEVVSLSKSQKEKFFENLLVYVKAHNPVLLEQLGEAADLTMLIEHGLEKLIRKYLLDEFQVGLEKTGDTP